MAASKEGDFAEEALLDTAGIEQFQQDVDTLLALYDRSEDCMQFLQGLGEYSSASGHAADLEAVCLEYELAVRILLQDQVNSTAAMKVRPYLGDCIPYPLAVLLEALSRATAIPVVFYIDIVLSVMSSAVNEESYVKNDPLQDQVAALDEWDGERGRGEVQRHARDIQSHG